tara:strand:+ start:1165 stop:1806 length:642 start_codon:yes stop_codon:yes gene_type:complete
MKLLIICYVPEIACKNNDSMKYISTKVEEAFLKASNSPLDTVKILEINRSLVIENLKEIAQDLSNPNKKAIIYYYGHGDQIRDRSGDEKDGKDEIWQTQRIIDDEISKIFANIHDSSTLYLFSDSCSSGSMIDEYYNKKDWVTLSSANDRQDSLATSDGGVFTLWGLIPALENVKECTPNNIHNYIKNNVQIQSQTSLIHYINKKTIYEPIFD